MDSMGGQTIASTRAPKGIVFGLYQNPSLTVSHCRSDISFQYSENSNNHKPPHVKEAYMDTITSFLSNPLVSLIGYTLSLIASIVAIYQFFQKKKAVNKISELMVEIKNHQTKNSNKISLGEKSQYFQDNSGPITIDNRG